MYHFSTVLISESKTYKNLCTKVFFFCMLYTYSAIETEQLVEMTKSINIVMIIMLMMTFLFYRVNV